MSQNQSKGYQLLLKKGFSLIEFSIALVVVGFFITIGVTLIPRLMSSPIFGNANIENTLDQATRAIDGFVIANGRLPCPATNSLGVEDCSVGVVSGWLPVRQLGISLNEPVRYGVYREPSAVDTLDKDLAKKTIPDRYKPSFPYSASYSYISKINGLDFCIGLLNLTETGGSVLTAGQLAIPIAYGIAVGGKLNADNLTSGLWTQLDGLNSVSNRFELAGRAKNTTYDDDTRTVGSAELFERLGCTQKLAAVNFESRMSNVAYDVDQVADFYVRFRTFQVKVSELDNSMVATARDLAAADLAIGIAGSAVSIAGSLETFGAGAFAIATSVAAVSMATYSLVEAVKAVPKAAQDLADARSMKSASDNFKLQTASDLNLSFNRMKALDAKGILP